MELAFGKPDFDLIAVLERRDDLAVEREGDLVVFEAAFGVDIERDLAVAGQHDGAHGQRGGADGREDDGLQFGVDNGTSGGE